MARKARIEYCGSVHHIYNRSIGEEKLFRDDSDYKEFIECLKTAKHKYPFYCYSYLLLPESFHLIIERTNEPVSVIMKSALGKYAMYYNNRYKRRGPLFEGRYRSKLKKFNPDFIALIRCIHSLPGHLNGDKVSDWKWSSCSEYTKKSYGLVDNKRAYEKYKESSGFSASQIRKKITAPLHEETLTLFKKLEKRSDVNISNISSAQEVLSENNLSIEKIAELVSGFYKISLDDLRAAGGSRQVSRARAAFCYLAHVKENYKNTAIAAFINKEPSTVTHAIERFRSNGEIKVADSIIMGHYV